MFVRDRGDRGVEPAEAHGPRGHHFSCDFLLNNTLASFRFTCREDDYLWVLDRNFSKTSDGRFTILGPGATYYDPATPGFATMTDLLLAVDEVQRAANIRLASSSYVAYMH